MLKSMNQKEVELLIELIRPWVGARLQQVQSAEDIIGLGFFYKGEVSWLVVDLRNPAPLALVLTSWPKELKAKTTPMQLFLKAQFLNHRLDNISLHERADRVFVLDFSVGQIEVRIFPHGQNILARTQEKAIAFHKPKKLVERTGAVTYGADSVRNLVNLFEDWRQCIVEKKISKKDVEKTKQKKTKAIETLQNYDFEGEEKELKTKISLLQHEGFFDEAENLFEKLKKLEQKKLGASDRILKLKKEIEQVDSGETETTVDAKKTSHRFQKTNAKFNTVNLSHKYQLLVGKSGKDNLAILRQSKPKDLWLHLRDYPGAHGILHFHDATRLSEDELKKVTERFVASSVGSRFRPKAGDPVDVVICECRFVRPIKGDKLGRVQFQNERIVRVKYSRITE